MRTPVGLGGVHQGIKGGAVVVFLQVAEFVDDDVADLRRWVLNQRGVESDDAAPAAIAPAAAHMAVAQRRHRGDPRAMWQSSGDEGGDVRQALRAMEDAEAGGKGGIIRRGGGEHVADKPDAGGGLRAQSEAVSGAEQLLRAAISVGGGWPGFLWMGVSGDPVEIAADEMFDVGTAAARRMREVEGAAAIHAEAQAAVVAARRAQVDAVGVAVVGDVKGVHGGSKGGDGLAVIKDKRFFRPAQSGETVSGVLRRDARLAVLPARADGVVAAENVVPGAKPVLRRAGKEWMIAAPAAPVVADDNGGRVMIILPPWRASDEAPTPTSVMRRGGRAFAATSQGADRIAPAVVAVTRGSRGAVGGQMAGIVQVAVARLLRLPGGIPRLLPRFFGKRVFPAAVVGDETVVRRSAQTGDGSRQPGGVNDAQVVPLQHERLCSEKAVQRCFAGGRVMPPRGEISGILIGTLREIPAGAWLGIAQQQVNFMIAEHHLRIPGGVGPHEPVKHGGNVVAAINEVADENEASSLWMTAVRTIAEVAE